MLKFLKYLAKYWWQVVILFAGVCLQVWSSLQLPDMMSQIVNKGIIGADQTYIYREGGLMLLVTIAGGIGTLVAGFFAARVGAAVAAKIREDTFKKVISFSPNETNKFSTASLITRSTNDVNQVQQVTIMGLRMALQAPLMGVGAVVKAFTTAPDMAWIIALAVGSLLTVIITVMIFALPKFRFLQKLIDKLNSVTRENLTGIRVVRAFNNEKYEQKKFQKANDELTKTNLFVNRVMVVVFPIVQLILNVTTLLVIWVGASFVEKGAVEIGNLMAFMQYALQVMMAFMFLAMIFIMLPRAMVSWKRIDEVLTTKLSIRPPKKAKKPRSGEHGIVEFKGVSFSYPDADEPVLRDISFKAEPGQTVAFIGSTGSGKSTLINLIPRFYDVSSGQVLLDGVDVRDYASKDLTDKIGYVPQRGVLFSGSVESNVAYGMDDKDEKRITKAIDIAQAHEFVRKMDDGVKSKISQGGTNVSGGQKQRLSIARAIAKDPEIYIFDDSFSALDYRTDRNLRAALKKQTKNATVLIVGQRISTIKSADKIIVLDEGKVVGDGTHRELLESCRVYQEIARSQLSTAEYAAEVSHGE
ncbi:ABC transporter ATP-binding protein/permease [Candidatus Saccharibacteria bacterium]|nr:ABC transporter ATP-binding protein/permease [Candidatus Saccharibacteria bacterium]